MKVVEFNNRPENPFYGLKNTLNLLQVAGINETSLNAAWQECKDDVEKRQLFWSLLFSIGDVTNRQHNIFKGVKKDNGGSAEREAFELIFSWMWKNHKEQFLKFMSSHLFNEFICYDVLFKNRVKTKNNKVVSVYTFLEDYDYREALLKYVYSVINGTNNFDKLCVAKFLTLPRLSPRQGHKKMMPETKRLMLLKCQFLAKLSELMGWEYDFNGSTYAAFPGYRKWRQGFNSSLESVLFSTKAVLKMDKDEFIKWFNALPAQARFRAKNKILYSKDKEDNLKWEKLQPWLQEWESYKESKQQEQRDLEELVRQNEATEQQKIQLQKVKKEAKITVGASNFKELYTSILRNNVDKLKLESFITNKVNLPYNTLCIIDDSGSMTGSPFNFAAFLAAVCLCKNPDDDGRNLLGFFGSTGRFYSFINKETRNSVNSILRREVAETVHKPLVDPHLSFIENYERINGFCHAVFQGGCTDITSILRNIVRIANTQPAVLDALKNFPVWTIISDGELNSMHSPEASFNDFFAQCERLLGFKPFIVAMDINDYNTPMFQKRVDRFSGIDNLMYIPSNPAQIEMFLTNFKDMDTFDIYTPLLSLWRSNRYELVRQNTL